MQKQSVLFLHLMKTAGMALNSFIGGEFPKERNLLTNPFKGSGYLNIYDTEEHLKTLAINYDYIPGHFNYYCLNQLRVMKAELRQEVITTTIFRDPIERIISLYKYYVKECFSPDLPYDAEQAHGSYIFNKFVHDKIDFGQFIGDGGPIQGLITNYQVRFLTSRSSSTFWDPLSRVDIEEAKHNLSTISVVGIQEEYDRYKQKLCEAASWAYRYDHEFHNNSKTHNPNIPVHMKTVQRNTITNAELNKLMELTEYDYEIYNYAKSIRK